ncbi:MAG: hypothetical protein JW915_13695 [Chitinispirillaceae bacterium]|nr:hypothetical protein [Chitinispirillaceae bacterium]
MPVPKPKAVQLIEELRNYTDSPIDEFSLNKSKYEAERLISIDPVNAYVALGIINTLLGKEDEMNECYKIALEIAPTDSIAVHNYAVSLSRFAHFKEAFKILKDAYLKQSNNLGLLKDVLDYALFCGSFKEAKEFLISWNKLANRKFDGSTRISNLCNLTIKYRISQESCELLFKCVEYTFGNFDPNIWKNIDIRTFEDCIQFVFNMNSYRVDTNLLIDIEDKFIELVEENGLSHVLNFINIGFTLDNYNDSFDNDLDFFDEYNIEEITEDDLKEIDSLLQ